MILATFALFPGLPFIPFMTAAAGFGTLAYFIRNIPLVTRAALTKKIWDYVKKNNLQDPNDKRTIVADDKLKPVFGGKEKVSMFEMTKLVNQHVK